MNHRKVVALGFLVVLLRASPAAAQACLGLHSFGAAGVRINAAVELADSATALAVGAGFGRDNQAFANLGGGQVTYDGFDEKSTFGFLEFGYELPLGRARVCPIAGGTLQSGPNDDLAGLEVKVRGVSAGVAAGVRLGTGMLTIIPNAALKYDYVSVKVTELDIGSITDKSSSGIADLGLGFAFRNRFTILPLLHIPFGGDDDEITYGVFASLGFNLK
jgi:hypothetical protein